MKYSAFALIFASLFSGISHAEDCLETNQQFPAFRNLIHKVGVVDEDGRKTEEEYAASKALPLNAVQNRFAATGRLKCGDWVMTAQLTGCNNVITTAAHNFVDLKNCKKLEEPTSCTYTTRIGEYEQISKVKSIKGIGTTCPSPPHSFEDWSVLVIDPVPKNVEPYDLPGPRQVATGDGVISVSAGARDFTRLNKKANKKEMVKTIEECQIKDILVFELPAVFDSNCDFAQGNSGGSIVNRVNGKDTLVGISISSHESEAMIDRAVKTGKPNAGSYKANKWGTRHIPLNDQFLKSVRSACDGQSI